MKIRWMLLASIFFLFLGAAVNADTYRDADFGFQITPPDSWKTKAYFDGKERLFDAMSRDGNVLVRVRAIHLPRTVSMDVLRRAYERKSVSGASPYRETATRLNNVEGRSYAYHWRYRGHKIDVVSFFAIQPKTAYVVTRIIPDQMVNARGAEADGVIRTFRTTAGDVASAGAAAKAARDFSAEKGKTTAAPSRNIEKQARRGAVVKKSAAADAGETLSQEEIDEIMNKYLE